MSLRKHQNITSWKALIGFLFIAVVLTSCVSTYGLRPIGPEANRITYTDGIPYSISHTDQRIVAAGLYKNEEGYLEILLGIKNIDTIPITFFPDKVTLFTSSDYYGMSQLKVYTPEQWIRKIQTEQVLTAIAVGLNQGVEAYNAGRSTTYGTATAYGSDGSYARAYGYSQTIDYTKQAQVRQMHQQELARWIHGFAARFIMLVLLIKDEHSLSNVGCLRRYNGEIQKRTNHTLRKYRR